MLGTGVLSQVQSEDSMQWKKQGQVGLAEPGFKEKKDEKCGHGNERDTVRGPGNDKPGPSWGLWGLCYDFISTDTVGKEHFHPLSPPQD